MNNEEILKNFRFKLRMVSGGHYSQCYCCNLCKYEYLYRTEFITHFKERHLEKFLKEGKND